MNAASKGHLPVVLYLLNKHSADPLIRNNWGETAYDAAAAVFEVWICEVRGEVLRITPIDSEHPVNRYCRKRKQKDGVVLQFRTAL